MRAARPLRQKKKGLPILNLDARQASIATVALGDDVVVEIVVGQPEGSKILDRRIGAGRDEKPGDILAEQTDRRRGALPFVEFQREIVVVGAPRLEGAVDRGDGAVACHRSGVGDGESGDDFGEIRPADRARVGRAGDELRCDCEARVEARVESVVTAVGARTLGHVLELGVVQRHCGDLHRSARGIEDEIAGGILAEGPADVVQHARAFILGALEAHAANQPQPVVEQPHVAAHVGRRDRLLDFLRRVGGVDMGVRGVEDEPRWVRIVERLQVRRTEKIDSEGLPVDVGKSDQ